MLSNLKFYVSIEMVGSARLRRQATPVLWQSPVWLCWDNCNFVWCVLIWCPMTIHYFWFWFGTWSEYKKSRSSGWKWKAVLDRVVRNNSQTFHHTTKRTNKGLVSWMVRLYFLGAVANCLRQQRDWQFSSGNTFWSSNTKVTHVLPPPQVF